MLSGVDVVHSCQWSLCVWWKAQALAWRPSLKLFACVGMFQTCWVRAYSLNICKKGVPPFSAYIFLSRSQICWELCAQLVNLLSRRWEARSVTRAVGFTSDCAEA